MKLQPLHDNVVIERSVADDTTKGGIIVPDKAKEKQAKGKVVAVGPGRYHNDKLVPLQVAVGDTVLFTEYSGTEVEVDGKKYLMMGEGSILSKID